MLWAFGGTVLASGAASASLGPRPSTFVAQGLALLMMGLAFRCRSVEKRSVFRYFVAQFLLATGVLFCGEGRGVLVVMPLLSQLALVAPRRTVALYACACACVFAFSFAPHAPSPGLVAGQLVAFFAAAVFTIVFTEVAVSERRARTRKEELAEELAAAQTRIAELAVADERLRLAREIHDGLGHALTAARMQIEGATAVLDADPVRAKEALGKASRLVREGLVEVRQSVGALREDGAPVPLDERLRRLVREAPADLLVEVETVGEGALSSAEEHALYRVAQEALTNVGRHAAATRVRIVVERTGHRRALSVDDDGAGGAIVPGVGLTGMRERLARLGGELAIEARPGGGTRIVAVLPLRA